MGYGIYKNMYIKKKKWIWQLVLDGVVDMDEGYKASYPGSKHHCGVFRTRLECRMRVEQLKKPKLQSASYGENVCTVES